jgi:hypothetical protein
MQDEQNTRPAGKTAFESTPPSGLVAAPTTSRSICPSGSGADSDCLHRTAEAAILLTPV